MKAYVFTDKSLERYAGQFVWLSIDSENGKNAAFLAKYPINVLPTLIVVGSEDVSTPPRDARALHAAIPGSRLEVLQQAGHLSNLERPAAFNTVVTEFLGSLLYN